MYDERYIYFRYILFTGYIFDINDSASSLRVCHVLPPRAYFRLRNNKMVIFIDINRQIKFPVGIDRIRRLRDKLIVVFKYSASV